MNRITEQIPEAPHGLCFRTYTQNISAQRVASFVNAATHNTMAADSICENKEKTKLTGEQEKIKTFLENIIHQLYNNFIFESNIYSIEIDTESIISLDINNYEELSIEKIASLLYDSAQIINDFGKNKNTVIRKMYQKIPELCGPKSLFPNEEAIIQEDTSTRQHLDIITHFIVYEEERKKERKFREDQLNIKKKEEQNKKKERQKMKRKREKFLSQRPLISSQILNIDSEAPQSVCSREQHIRHCNEAQSTFHQLQTNNINETRKSFAPLIGELMKFFRLDFNAQHLLEMQLNGARATPSLIQKRNILISYCEGLDGHNEMLRDTPFRGFFGLKRGSSDILLGEVHIPNFLKGLGICDIPTSISWRDDIMGENEFYKSDLLRQYIPPSVYAQIDELSMIEEQEKNDLKKQLEYVTEKPNLATTKLLIDELSEKKDIINFFIQGFYAIFLLEQEIPFDSIDEDLLQDIKNMSLLDLRYTIMTLCKNPQIQKDFEQNKQMIIEGMYEKIPELFGEGSGYSYTRPIFCDIKPLSNECNMEECIDVITIYIHDRIKYGTQNRRRYIAHYKEDSEVSYADEQSILKLFDYKEKESSAFNFLIAHLPDVGDKTVMEIFDSIDYFYNLIKNTPSGKKNIAMQKQIRKLIKKLGSDIEQTRQEYQEMEKTIFLHIPMEFSEHFFEDDCWGIDTIGEVLYDIKQIILDADKVPEDFKKQICDILSQTTINDFRHYMVFLQKASPPHASRWHEFGNYLIYLHKNKEIHKKVNFLSLQERQEIFRHLIDDTEDISSFIADFQEDTWIDFLDQFGEDIAWGHYLTDTARSFHNYQQVIPMFMVYCFKKGIDFQSLNHISNNHKDEGNQESIKIDEDMRSIPHFIESNPIFKK